MGLNTMVNKLYCLKSKIQLTLFNLTHQTYKNKGKIMFKPYENVNQQ